MNKYELVYVIDTTLDDDARKAVMDRFHGMLESLGGKVEKVEEWGKRRLAYPINYKTEGYYVLVNYTAEASVPKEIERNLQISDSILRYLTVKRPWPRKPLPLWRRPPLPKPKLLLRLNNHREGYE